MISPLQIMEILLDKIRALPQYQQLLKQVQANGKQIPGLGLPRAAPATCPRRIAPGSKQTDPPDHRSLRSRIGSLRRAGILGQVAALSF